MKKIFKLLIISLFTLAFTSCEDVVQIKLDEGSKLYVVDAFINDQLTQQVVKVTTNDSYFSNREAPGVTNANVTLVDLTTNTNYSFSHTGNGRYIFNNLDTNNNIGKIGHSYQLKVKIDGFEYTSTTTQKRTAIIDSISALYNEGQDPFGGPKDTYNCFLFARDKADNNTDYYWIRTFRNDTLFNDPSDLNISIDGTNGAVVDAPADSIDFTAPITFLGFKTYRENDKCKVEIHSISRETYFFFVQAIAQINNGGLFATTPENVKTNIVTPDGAKTKAIGWFNMATVYSKTKLVK
jgi:hypothetical protein